MKRSLTNGNPPVLCDLNGEWGYPVGISLILVVFAHVIMGFPLDIFVLQENHRN